MIVVHITGGVASSVAKLFKVLREIVSSEDNSEQKDFEKAQEKKNSFGSLFKSFLVNGGVDKQEHQTLCEIFNESASQNGSSGNLPKESHFLAWI